MPLEFQCRIQKAVAHCCLDKEPMLAATAALSLGHAGLSLLPVI